MMETLSVCYVCGLLLSMHCILSAYFK
uniref:Uncharacterized protein n=1 Tax=Anguilla anguilla TaxID=7936 RepID=A0A0E9QDE3_ANGAN